MRLGDAAERFITDLRERRQGPVPDYAGAARLALEHEAKGGCVKEELRVRYTIEEGIDAELDKALIALLEECGWHFWASGCDLNPTGERDLAFDREEVGDEPE